MFINKVLEGSDQYRTIENMTIQSWKNYVYLGEIFLLYLLITILGRFFKWIQIRTQGEKKPDPDPGKQTLIRNNVKKQLVNVEDIWS